jgi:VanZ family protein
VRILRQWLPVLLWAALILSASNDKFSTQHTAGWMHALLGRDVPWLLHVLVRKAAHMLEYGILAALAWRAHRSIGVPLLIVVLVASTDEWMQSHTAARTGTPWDVVLDVSAAMIVVAAFQSSSRRVL